MAKTTHKSFQFMLRMPDDLRDALRAAAEANDRTVTAEVIGRLEASLADERSLAETIKRVEEQLDTLKATQSFFVGVWEDALQELRETGSLSEKHRQFVTEMTAMMRKSVGERKPSVFD